MMDDLYRVRVVPVLALLLLVGCQQPHDINTVYGRRRGNGTRSVNGTAVLARMFSQSGARVSSWRRLSPKLEKEDVIVWFPDDFSVPSAEAVQYLDHWLADRPRRTLIVVGRDYDAAIDYWQQILKAAPPEQRVEIRRKLGHRRAEQAARRHVATKQSQCDWFTLDTSRPPRQIESLEGPWSDGVDMSRMHLSQTTEIKLPDSVPEDEWGLRTEVLLQSNEEVLVGRLEESYWTDSQLIVVANGAWLLNLPLVNGENQYLAGKLIEQCHHPTRVCFLETGSAPVITDSDTTLPLMLRAFTIAPTHWILLHLTVLGIIFCFAILPIFGRPRRHPRDDVSDFGKHIAAVGDLLERGGDRSYAGQRIRAYSEMVHPRSSNER